MRTLFINAFAIIASLLALANLAMTSAYTARAPQGQDAMGLIIPLGASVISALCLLAATGLALSGGRLAWIDPRSGVTTALAMLVALGIGSLIVCALVAWSGRGNAWAAPVGIIGAGVAPLLLSALLMMSRAPIAGETLPAPLPRWIAGALVPIACVGVALAFYFIAGAMRDSAARATASANANAALEEKWARIRNRTPIEAAREDMAAMDSAAPLWTIVGGLPEQEDAGARSIIVERALKVPALDDEIAQTLGSQYPRYRHGTLIFLQQLSDDRRPAKWGAHVAASLDSTAAEIASAPDWFTADETRNSRPVEFVRAMNAAPSLFADGTAISNALQKLKAAITASPASAARDSALAILNTPRD